METADMVHQANQIAQFFANYPEAEAVASVEDHLRKFWAPPMRKQLLAYLAAGGAGLHRLVVSAGERLGVARVS